MNEVLSGAWRHFLDEHADEHVRVLAADMFASGARATIDRLDRDGPDGLDAIRAELDEGLTI